MLAILQVVVGILFILLLFSLLASNIMEMLSGFLSLRGTFLHKGLHNMLGDKVLGQFVNHPFFRQMTQDGRKKVSIGARNFPSYISPQAFRSILMDVVDKPDADMDARFEHLEDKDLREMLTFLWKEAQGDEQIFHFRIEAWFNQVMERVAGWFKRATQYWLVGVGAVLALLFNVDTIKVYQSLSENASLREQIGNTATGFVERRANDGSTILMPSPVTSLPSTTEAIGQTLSLKSSPLGLGWSAADAKDVSLLGILTKLVGLLTTALAISMGAPFWFDLLSKLVNIRNSGTTYSSDEAVG